MSPSIELKHVSFAYGETLALEDISFSLDEGDYAGLVGGNGSGKTTLLKVILGLLTPTNGEVFLFGQALRTFQAWEKIGYVPQQTMRADFAFPATVREVVGSGLGVLPLRERCIEEALRMAEVEHLSERLIGSLSGGERQRVFIARALLSEPKLLVLDEPTAGVDSLSQEKFYAFLKHLNRDRRMTILLVSHDLEVVTREVKTVLCLNRTLVCQTTPQDFLEGRYMEMAYGKGMQRLHHATHRH